MIEKIDYFLDRITMYRLLLYSLIALVGIVGIFGFLGLLPYSPPAIFFSVLFLVLMCWITNNIFSEVFQAPTNIESVYITALILALIIAPAQSIHDIIFLGWAAILAMASKYILAIGKKHIFNPVAIAVVFTSIGINQSANWWIGNAYMMPFIVVLGLLIVRKIRRFGLVFSFLITAILTILTFTFLKGNNVFGIFSKTLLHSSIFFFAFIMLTEPLTTPSAKSLRILYGILVGFLFAPQVHIGGIYSTPELALIVGNIFSYLVSPKQKLILKLREKIATAPDSIDFLFMPAQKLEFIPGQYMEWTLPHSHADGRGNRRYFTIASSPTENELRLGVKFYGNGSSYKKAMITMDEKTPIVASQISGDFTLPKNPQQKCVFIAGGIGITPFRSMIKYLIDMHQSRPIIIFYADKQPREIIYKDIFDKAQRELGIKTVYTITDKSSVTADWDGKVGRIDAQMIQEEAPDYESSVFYLSGPHNMVLSFEKVLINMGVKRQKIKTDYFPGLV